MCSDEQLMRDMERDFPGEDWGAVPDPETLPDVYTVHGRCREKIEPPSRDKGDDGTGYRTDNFSIEGEFATREEAETQLERCKAWDGVIIESLEIRAVKSFEAVCKHFYKDCRTRIMAGEKVCPIYLP